MGRGLWYTGGDLSEKFQGWRTVEGFKLGIGGGFFGDVETLAPSVEYIWLRQIRCQRS